MIYLSKNNFPPRFCKRLIVLIKQKHVMINAFKIPNDILCMYKIISQN